VQANHVNDLGVDGGQRVRKSNPAIRSFRRIFILAENAANSNLTASGQLTTSISVKVLVLFETKHLHQVTPSEALHLGKHFRIVRLGETDTTLHPATAATSLFARARTTLGSRLAVLSITFNLRLGLFVTAHGDIVNVLRIRVASLSSSLSLGRNATNRISRQIVFNERNVLNATPKSVEEDLATTMSGLV
jgi:hypothetical protein